MTDRMLQFFTYEHLPPHLQAVSKPFCLLAQTIVDTLPSNPERTVALRKLLESKDATVRAVLYRDEEKKPVPPKPVATPAPGPGAVVQPDYDPTDILIGNAGPHTRF